MALGLLPSRRMRAEGRLARPLGLVATWLVLGPLAGHSAHATTFVAMSEKTLARSSDAIVTGTVTALETVGDPSGGIWTLVTLAVDGRYKGDVGAEIVLKQPGGELADRGL